MNHPKARGDTMRFFGNGSMARWMFLAIAAVGLLSSVSEARVNLVVSPSWLSFSDVAVGGSSQTQYVYIRNYGNETARALRVYDSCGLSFDVQHSCLFDLRPYQSCSVRIRFTPNSTGYHNCTLQAHSSGGGTAYLTMSGTGIEPAELEAAE